MGRKETAPGLQFILSVSLRDLLEKKGKSPYEQINDRRLSKHTNGVHWWKNPQLRSVIGIAGGAWSV